MRSGSMHDAVKRFHEACLFMPDLDVRPVHERWAKHPCPTCGAVLPRAVRLNGVVTMRCEGCGGTVTAPPAMVKSVETGVAASLRAIL